MVLHFDLLEAQIVFSCHSVLRDCCELTTFVLVAESHLAC
jgi:hypothetical protein